MARYLWPGDAGWPEAGDEEPDEPEVIDLTGEIDLDALCLHVPPPHMWEDLTSMERQVLRSRFGLDGGGEHTMKQLHDELGITRAQVRGLLESALDKLRTRLSD